MPVRTAPSTPVVVLVDDVRRFPDERPCTVARTARQALAARDRLGADPIDELWLDFDLGNGATVRPVLDALVARRAAGEPVAIGTVYVHTASASGAHAIKTALRPLGYRIERVFARNRLTW